MIEEDRLKMWRELIAAGGVLEARKDGEFDDPLPVRSHAGEDRAAVSDDAFQVDHGLFVGPAAIRLGGSALGTAAL